MAGEFEILAFREASTMASSWTEYLCLKTTSTGTRVLEVCQYEPLAEYQGCDEDGNELPIPKMIGGKVVVGVEDGYLVGGNLSRSSDDMWVALEGQTPEDLYAVVKEWGFSVDVPLKKALDSALIR